MYKKPNNDTEEFSLVLGGPFYQLLRRTKLAGDHLERVKSRTLFITGFLWIPLLIFSALNGRAIGDAVAIPFLFDIEVQVRFLLVVPLMIASELIVHERIRMVRTQFLERKIIPEPLISQYEKAVNSAYRLRNSYLAEALIVIFVFAVGIGVVWKNVVAVSAPTWYSMPAGESSTMSLAGYWYVFVCMPVSQFLLMRWYYRMFIWIRFLFQVSRIRLNLLPTHPDNIGGLGFLSGSIQGFLPLAMVHGAILSGWVATRIFYLDGKLLDFKFEIITIVAFVLVIMLVPFLVFAGQLAMTKRKGIRDYGTLASRYVNEFDSKWREGKGSQEEAFIGSSDIQSLADLSNSYEVVRKMRIIPITKDMLVSLAVAVLLPVLPLALTMMPLEELLKILAGIIL